MLKLSINFSIFEQNDNRRVLIVFKVKIKLRWDLEPFQLQWVTILVKNWSRLSI